MPELPEVETIKRILEPQIRDKTIIQCNILNSQVIAHPDPDEFALLTTGKTVRKMNRRGKFLSILLDNGARVILHLRMTGQMLVTSADYPQEKHTHLILDLLDGSQLRYIDVRRFGRFWYLKKDEDLSVTGMDKLGIEPTSKKLTAEYLKENLSAKKKPIKEMLHDQSIIAGIGNIYSDEILYAAGLYPEEKCCDLLEDDWQRLADTIPKIIRWGIRTNRMTPEEYLAGKGKEYRNTPALKAYGHEGKACHKCGDVFQKITVGGRSSCFCPCCQRKRS